MTGDDKSVVKETKQGWRLEENKIGHNMTQIDAKNLTRKSRSVWAAAVDLSDEDENGKRGFSEQSGCKHGVALAIADRNEVKSRTKVHCRRRTSVEKSFDGVSVLDKIRHRGTEIGEGPLGFRWRMAARRI